MSNTNSVGICGSGISCQSCAVRFAGALAITATVLGILGLINVHPFHQMGRVGSIALISVPIPMLIMILTCLKCRQKSLAENQIAEQPQQPLAEVETPVQKAEQPHEYRDFISVEDINKYTGITYGSASGRPMIGPNLNMRSKDYFCFSDHGRMKFMVYSGDGFFGQEIVGDKPLKTHGTKWVLDVTLDKLVPEPKVETRHPLIVSTTTNSLIMPVT